MNLLCPRIVLIILLIPAMFLVPVGLDYLITECGYYVAYAVVVVLGSYIVFAFNANEWNINK